MVCIEDWQIRNMSKSSRGSTDTLGKNVRAKSGLIKNILDQGWYEFREPGTHRSDLLRHDAWDRRRRNPLLLAKGGCQRPVSS
jgi:hypothetical protein